MKQYDVLVVGGGHAGCEAALAASGLGAHTCLLTGSIERIAVMSCNPAIGGVGKGHLVKELDILGGHMPEVSDQTGIQFRTLNASRGPAVRATRCQSDMNAYARVMQKKIHNQNGLRLKQGLAEDLILGDADDVIGVVTQLGESIYAKRVILTTGTFMGGILHMGTQKHSGGRVADHSSQGLSGALKRLGLEIGRLKTGTCPRLDARTIDWNQLEEQPPILPPPQFSFGGDAPPLKQVSCYMAHTNETTHSIIRDVIESGEAPLFNGQIDGVGPRYCPSIEDKVMRFQEKKSHLIFLEPHGLDTHEIYPNGLSTSLPPDVQLKFLRTIPGLEHVEVTRWGYAVEYDFVIPTQLKPWLATKIAPALYTAGQINGTTGYEEAAIQGFLAGVNATRSLNNQSPIIIGRHEAYAGVLIDDLVTQGTDEPYRMFTSRAEHRLLLREDNTHLRLLELGLEIGLLSQEKQEKIQAFIDATAVTQQLLTSASLSPSDEINQILSSCEEAPLNKKVTFEALLKRPKLSIKMLEPIYPELFKHPELSDSLRNAMLKHVEIEIKYAGYLQRAEKDIAREQALEDAILPDTIFEHQLPGMSNEVFEKLNTIRPHTLGQAARISGITPAAIGLLAIAIKKHTDLTSGSSTTT